MCPMTARDHLFSRSHDGFDAAFGSLHTLLMSLEGVDEFLQEVADLVSDTLTSCGITVEYENYPLTVASSDARARSLDESQYAAHEGTCLHAMRSGETVAVPDAEGETRWPAYFKEARKTGLRSSLSLPLIVRGESIGAMNLYSFEHTHAFDGELGDQARLFASQASTALWLAVRLARSNETNRQLETALTSRSIIDQALGVLMAQQRCTPEEAFALLRTHSQHNNRKLREVAEELVTRIAEPQDRSSDGQEPPDVR